MEKFYEKLYLRDMYNDDYYPDFLVDKIKALIAYVVELLENGERDMEVIQDAFDNMTIAINDLEGEFDKNDSEIETVARDSIGETVIQILNHFGIEMDVEDAIRKRNW